jgi:hypothetical protein
MGSGCLICIWAFALWHMTTNMPTQYATIHAFKCFIEVPLNLGLPLSSFCIVPWLHTRIYAYSCAA